jgi:hypothetical protein
MSRPGVALGYRAVLPDVPSPFRFLGQVEDHLVAGLRVASPAAHLEPPGDAVAAGAVGARIQRNGVITFSFERTDRRYEIVTMLPPADDKSGTG